MFQTLSQGMVRTLRRHISSQPGRPGVAQAPTAPALPLNLLDSTFLADPYPTYAWLRDNLPVAPVASGGHLLTCHADVKAALSSPLLGNAPSRFSVLHARNRDRHVAADLAAHLPPFLDLPQHRLPRQAISRAFHRAMATAPPLEAIAQDCVQRQAGHGPVDLLEGISRPFALEAMRRLLGLNAPDAVLKPASQAFFALFAPLSDPATFQALNVQMTALRGLVARALAQRRAGVPRDFLGHMAQLQADLPELTDQHIVDATILLLADGVENIETGAATLLHLLARHGCPEGEVDEAWLREALRLDTPGQIIPRVATRDHEIRGIAIRADHPVFLALGSANRDPAVFDDPDLLDPHRNRDAALVFGRGAHRCIGEPLGIALLLTLLRALQATGARPLSQGPMAYQPRFGHRWPARLEVVIPVSG